MSSVRSTCVSVCGLAWGFVLEVGDVSASCPVAELTELHTLSLHLVHGEAPAAIGACLDPVIAYPVHVASYSASKCLMTDCAVFWSVSDDGAIALVACPLHDWSFFRVLSLS